MSSVRVPPCADSSSAPSARFFSAYVSRLRRSPPGHRRSASTEGLQASRATLFDGSLTDCKGEKGGSPYGVPGGANPWASSSPEKQAMASGALLLLTLVDVKQIATGAAKAVGGRLTGRAAKEAVEKKALEAAEQAWKQGAQRGSTEAV